MPDREKVIEGLAEIIDQEYEGWLTIQQYGIVRDAIALIKEQEAVKPRISSVEQRCGNCNKVIEMDGWITCPWCGKAILWENR